MLAPAGAVTLSQRGQDQHHAELGGDVVGVGGERPCWDAVGPAGHRVEARNGRRHGAEAGVQAHRAGLAHQAAREHHEVGVHLAQHVVGEAPVLHRLGRERLGEHVAPPHQVEHHVARLGQRQVEREVHLPGVDRVELQGVLLPAFLADERVDAAQHVGLQLALDLHHRGAVVGQRAGGAGTCQRPHEVQNLHVLQRPLHGAPCRRHRCPRPRDDGRAGVGQVQRGVLAEAGRGRQVGQRLAGGLGEGAAEPHRRRAVSAGHLHLLPVVAHVELFEGQHVGGRRDGRDQQVVGQRPFQQLGLRLGGHERGQCLDGLIERVHRLAALHDGHAEVHPVLVAQLRLAEPLLAGPAQDAAGERGDHGAEQERDGHVAVRALVHPRDQEAAQVHRAGQAHGHLAAGEHRHHLELRAVHERLLARRVHVLAQPGVLSLVQGHEHGAGRVRRGVVPRLRRPDAHRRPVAVAGQRHGAARSRDGEIGGCPACLRAGLAERRDGRSHELRVRGAQRIEVDVEHAARDHRVAVGR